MLMAIALGWVFGVSSQLLWPVLPSLPLLLAILVLLSLAGLAGYAGVAGPRIAPPWRQTGWALAGCAAGMVWAACCVGAVLEATLPSAREGEDMVVEGKILSRRQHADGSTAYTVAATALPWLPDADWRPVPDFRLRISSWQPIAIEPGERWRLHVRLKRPRASQNPGVADFERYLLGERVVASGYVHVDDTTMRLAPAAGWSAWRARLLASALPLMGAGAGDIAADDAQRFARAVLPALIVDERSLLGSAQWRVLADTGTAHLVAISGLHVALLWAATLWIFAIVLRRRMAGLRFRFLTVVPALAVAWAYAALAGMPLPALRAVIMLAAATFFLLTSGAIPVWRVLLAATAVVLVFDPLSAHATGFWLSHGAVACLLLLNDLRRRAPESHGVVRRWLSGAREGVRMQTGLSILIAPMLIGLFGAASISSVFANLPAIPLVNLLALPPGLLGFLLAPWWPQGANYCIDLAVTALSWLWTLLLWVDSAAWLSPVRAHGAEVAGVVALMIGLAVWCASRSWPLRAALIALLVLGWPVAAGIPPGEARACVLDVGQGLAVVVRTAHHAVLYDAGPLWGTEMDAGSAIVVPAARALGIHRLDLLVLSHNDQDHTGGAAAVVESLVPRDIVLGNLQTRTKTGDRGRHCGQMQRWQYDGVDFLLLPGADVGSNRSNENDRSCILRIAAGAHALLLPGDISQRRELDLSAQWGDALRANVLVAAHHGSRTSSSLTFLHRVAPQQMIFSAGYRNRFGHPHPAVVAAAERVGAVQYGTAASGALCLRLAPDAAPVVAGWRSQVRRVWQRHP